MSAVPFQARVVNSRNNTYELRLFREGETHFEARRRKDKELFVLARRRSDKGAPLWMTASASRINRVRPFTVGAARRLLVPDDLFIVCERKLRRSFDARSLREMGAVLFCSRCGAAGVLTWGIPPEAYRYLREQALRCAKCEASNK